MVFKTILKFTEFRQMRKESLAILTASKLTGITRSF